MIEIGKKTHKTNLEILKRSEQALDKFLSRKEIGFPQLPERDFLWKSSQEQADKLRQKFTDLVIVGIGGSSLGPRVISELFQNPQATHRLHFCDNVDPQEFERLFLSIPSLEKTVWLIISKSGSTIETLTSTDFIVEKYNQNAVTIYDKVVVISEKKSNPLILWAEKHGIPQLEIPLDVGGRFSVLTPVGLVPLAFLGLPLDQVKDGARWSLQQKKLVAEIIAQSVMSFERQEWISFFWFYSSSLKSFGAWVQQLWAESLGKKFDNKGLPAPRVSSPMSAVGACDQHSVLQQVIEGAKDKFVIFVRDQALESSGLPLKKSEFATQQFFVGRKMGELLAAESSATQEALNQEKVSTLCLKIADQSPETLGALFMFWQLVVAGLGELLEINAFNQPGVEIGKKLAKESLKA